MRIPHKSKKRKLNISAPSKRSSESNEESDDLQEFRRNLPVAAYRSRLVQCISSSDDEKVLLVAAETGSGKSTQIPAYFIPHFRRILVTQPRRVAAMTLAQRVAREQQQTQVGPKIGYRVRFDDCTTDQTRLVYATDGMVLREAMSDPLLLKYGCVFLDECHERSLQTDILIGVIQRARRARKEQEEKSLKVVLMSATLEVETFQDFFGKESVTVMQIPGRQFHVQVLYASEAVSDYIEAALSTVVQIHTKEPPGDILVFLTGQEEIDNLSNLLQDYLKDQTTEDIQQCWTGDSVTAFSTLDSVVEELGHYGVQICPLYASLPPEAQLAAFQPKPAGCTRKIVLATNIAETSVTIPDIRYVVDTGKHKSRQIVSVTGMETLQVQDVSQAQADQRKGRAGRVQAGLCFRLYTQDAFASLEPSSVPEIQRVGLAQVVLQLKGMGVKDPRQFDFVTPPSKAGLIQAVKLLYALQALDGKEMELTDYGRQLSDFPLEPTHGHLLLCSAKYACTKEVLIAVSLLSTDHLLFRPHGNQNSDLAQKATRAHRRFVSHEGDLPTFLNIYHAWRNEAIYVPPTSGGLKAMKKVARQETGSHQRHLHLDWCRQNFVSGRSLARAQSIRDQLEGLCRSQKNQQLDVTASCGADQKIFLKCLAAGFFLQVASRVRDDGPARGRYKTKLGKDFVNIHPTSLLFGRQPAPACVVYSEQVTTKRTYIRGVTQIREDWLAEVAPNFYSNGSQKY